MVKVVKVDKYQCSKCNELHNSKKDALDCERRDLKKKFDKDKEKVFPTYVRSKRKDGLWDENEDSRYVYHCIICGKVLVQYDTYWDGHRNNPGDLIYKEAYTVIKGARVCPDCQTSKILLKRLEELGELESQYARDLAEIVEK